DGESKLNEVAKRLGVSAEALRDANPQIKGNKVQAGQELKLPEKQSSKSQSTTQDSTTVTKHSSHSSAGRAAEMKLTGSYVEASLRNRVETSGGSARAGAASPLNGMRLGWLKDGSEVKI